MRNAAVVLFSAGILCACSGPVGPIPGGTLQGKPAPWPDEWVFTDEFDNILLQTRPDDPYSVTLWAVSCDGNFYVVAEKESSRWVQNIKQNANVVVSVGGMLYNAKASIVSDSEEIDKVAQAYVAKYEFDSKERLEEEDGILFRLSRP